MEGQGDFNYLAVGDGGCSNDVTTGRAPVTCACVTSETGSDCRGRSRLLGRSATTNPFGGGALSVKPPEKGVFPLDRQGTVSQYGRFEARGAR